jgi:hypothetical protein
MVADSGFEALVSIHAAPRMNYEPVMRISSPFIVQIRIMDLLDAPDKSGFVCDSIRWLQPRLRNRNNKTESSYP